MCRHCLLIVLALLHLAVASPVAADAEDPNPTRAGRLIVTVPAGWSVGHDEGMLELRLDDSDLRWDEQPRLYVTPGTELPGTPSAVLSRGKAEAAEVLGPRFIDADDGESLTVQRWGPAPQVAGLNVALGAALKRDADGDFVAAYIILPVVGPSTPGRSWLQYVVARAGTADGDSVARVSRAAEQMVSSLRLLPPQPAPAQLLEGAATPQPLTGLYSGSRLDLQSVPDFNGGMQMQTRMVSRRFVFFPSGHFSDGVPEGGITAFDYARASEALPDGVGVFRVTNRRDEDGDPLMELRYADGSTDELVMHDNGAIQDGLIWMFPGTVAPDGLRFDGAYSRSYHFSSGGGAMALAIFSSASSSTTFSRDGTWSRERDSVTSASGSAVAIGVGSGPETTRGTYAVSGGELVMRDARGAEVDRGTLVLDTWNDEEEGRQQALYFGGIEIDVAHPLPEGVPAEVLFRGPAAMNPLEVPARPMNPLE